MPEIFVLAEHRQGAIRDITYEMLTKALEIAEKTNAELTAIILGKTLKNKQKHSQNTQKPSYSSKTQNWKTSTVKPTKKS